MSALNYVIDSLLVLYSLYYLTFVLIGLFDNDLFGDGKDGVSSDPKNRFAIFVPAHNEEKVISKLLSNLENLDYPSRLYDVFVIADNCQDDTGSVARRHDVNVIERNNQEEKGKGYALKYGFDRIGFLDGSADYDAVTVFDADNLVEDDFLGVMNDRLESGEKLIQSYVDSKNPSDNWVTATFSMMFWINDRYTLLSRYNVGLSAVMMGTGMCISAEVLEEIGWDTKTLTEDLEYSIQALFRGIKTSFTRETRVFDEKPVSFFASCRQRLRWARGQLSVLKNYVPRLLYQGLREANPVKIDGGIRLFQMPFIMFYFLVTVLRWIMPGIFSGPVFDYVVSNIKLFGVVLPLMPFIIPSSLFILDRLPEEAFKYVFLFPVFMYSWIAILYYAVFTLDRTEWIHTSHFRNIDKKELKTSELVAAASSRNIGREKSKSMAIPRATKVTM
jgi:cellulose synthase/poly-beta-1,6-N-acetylglucosamine synthase-like glycosyltransferase